MPTNPRAQELRREVDELFARGYRFGSREVRGRLRELDALEAADATASRAARLAARTPREIVDKVLGVCPR